MSELKSQLREASRAEVSASRSIHCQVFVLVDRLPSWLRASRRWSLQLFLLEFDVADAAFYG
jgi:hypothetical protein